MNNLTLLAEGILSGNRPPEIEVYLNALPEWQRRVYVNSNMPVLCYLLHADILPATEKDKEFLHSLFTAAHLAPDKHLPGIIKQHEIKYFAVIHAALSKARAHIYPDEITGYLVFNSDGGENTFYNTGAPIECRRFAFSYALELVQYHAENNIKANVSIHAVHGFLASEHFYVYDSINEPYTFLPNLAIEGEIYRARGYDAGIGFVRVEIPGAHNFDILHDSYRLHKIDTLPVITDYGEVIEKTKQIFALLKATEGQTN